MTEGDHAPATVATAFAFNRLLDDPQVRDHLESVGWHAGMDMFPSADDETVLSLAFRLAMDASSSPCLIFWRSDAEPHGFAVMFAEPITQPARLRPFRQRRPETIKIQPNTTVGMLYAALQGCADFVPNEWLKPVRFLCQATA